VYKRQGYLSWLNTANIESLLNSIEPETFKNIIPLLKKQTENTLSDVEPANKDQLKANAVSFFCSIVDQCGIIKKGYDESNEAYCKKVIDHFKLIANPNKSRQFFRTGEEIKKTDKRLIYIIKKILPLLENQDREKIEAFINNKIKLYV
jgi:hypothetical protein